MTTYLKIRTNTGFYVRMNLGMLEAIFPLQKKMRMFYIVQLLVIRTLSECLVTQITVLVLPDSEVTNATR